MKDRRLNRDRLIDGNGIEQFADRLADIRLQRRYPDRRELLRDQAAQSRVPGGIYNEHVIGKAVDESELEFFHSFAQIRTGMRGVDTEPGVSGQPLRIRIPGDEPAVPGEGRANLDHTT